MEFFFSECLLAMMKAIYLECVDYTIVVYCPHSLSARSFLDVL